VSHDEYLMMGSDGEVQAVDLGPMLRRHRARAVEARAGLVDQAADLLMCEAFDARATCDAAEAAGMTEPMMDAAGNVARELLRVEELRG
jgi:hypothetical protein